jgi:predicted small secreted protein
MEMFLLMSSIILLGYLVYLFYLIDDKNRKLDNIMKQLKVVFKGKNDEN